MDETRTTSLPSSSIAATSSTSSCDIFYFARFFSAGIIFYIVRLSLLPTFSTAVIVFLCCSRLLFVGPLLSLSLTVTISNIASCKHLCWRDLSQLRVAIIFHFFVRLSLLPTFSAAVCVFICCLRLLFSFSTASGCHPPPFRGTSFPLLLPLPPLRATSSVEAIFYFCAISSTVVVFYYHHRHLLLNPSSSTATVIFDCHHRLPLLPSSFTATIVLPCYRHLLLPASSSPATVTFYCRHRLPLLPSSFTATIVWPCYHLLFQS
ncbi:hypothetical protein CEXT_535361 [Caerostris extrusa]|uniref:Uncharacterized protein n=1 Tax=Caerostris extrusa TaxID=172846 RepID=A0AAV4MXV5_CAEEX|nr:hypothetical protein CEXT_535361 [Caerostris extrusa]